MEHHVRRTRMVMVWESVWPCLIPALSIGLLVIGLTLTGVFELLPATGHIILLSMLSVAALVSIVLPWRHFKRPTRRDVLQRIEIDNHLDNNPLQSLEDHVPDTDDPLTSYLWQRQLGLHEAALANLRLSRPQPALARIDRFGLTAIPVLLLFVGLMTGTDHVAERFSRAFSPLQRLGAADFSATLWVTPPAYTGQIPRILQFSSLSDDAGSRQSGTGTGTGTDRTPDIMSIQVPVGSTLDGSISSIWEPTLSTPSGAQAFTESTENNYVLSTAIDQPGQWRISVWGNDRLTLDINLLADKPPSLSFISPPTVTRRDHVRLDYVASDDYGLNSLDLVITPGGEENTIKQYGPIDQVVIDLKSDAAGPLGAGTMPTRIEGPRFIDLVAHPWAGLPVNIQMVSRDNADQQGESDIRSLMLPEREFTHPVAQKLIAIRRGLLRYPDRVLEMHQALLPVLFAPQAFSGHLGVFLTLSVAENRLASNLHDRDTHQNVAGLLWHVAEEIERGSYGIAERNLMEAEERLLEALANPDVTEAEIARLIDEYRQALNEYLAALMRESQETTEEQPTASATLEQQDLSRIIDQIDALMRAGARDQARQLIDRLRELVENMQVTTGQGGMDITSTLREMLDGMRDLSRRQQDLMNEGDNTSPQNGNGPRANQQQGLADDAGEILQSPGLGQFGDVSGMNSVIDAMRGAAEALGNNRSHEALQYQRQAMDALQHGIGEISRTLEGLSQLAPMLEDLEGAGRRDPLGRPVGGDGTTIIPDVNTLERAWRILQELRRRSGDPERPQIEQEYIDRLLRRF
jgi:uncharacterized protein (TIGR02302 family)